MAIFIECPICHDRIKKGNWVHMRVCRINFEKTLDYTDVYNRYINEQYSILDMSEHYGIPMTWVRLILADLNIPQRSIKEACTKRRQQKAEKTCLKTQGAKHNFCKNSKSRQEWEERLYKEEGIKNVFQRKEVVDKIKQTKIAKYGDNWKWQHAKVNFIEHYIQKYGTEEGPKIFESVCKRKGEGGKRSHYVELYGEDEGNRIFNERMANNHRCRHYDGLNKKCAELLDQLNVKYEQEFYFPCEKHSYRYDFKIHNLILELNGTYWHCDPKKYKPNDLVKFPQGKLIRAKDKWQYDTNKNKWAIDNGYKVEVIWESDINIDLLKNILTQHKIPFNDQSS